MNRRIKRIGQIAGALLLGLLISASVFAGEDAPKAGASANAHHQRPRLRRQQRQSSPKA